MNTLGQCYKDGIGVTKDEKIAVNFFVNAARFGHTGAICTMGYYYENGVVVR